MDKRPTHSTRALSALVLAATFAGLSVLLPVSPQAPLAAQDATRSEAELRQLFTGAWHLSVSDAAGQREIERGIEAAVSEMNFFLQGVTRDQMRQRTPLNRRIDIGFESDGRISIGFDQRFTYLTRPGVAQDFTLPEGDTVNVRQYFRGQQLEQYFAHSIGERWNAFTLDAAGTTMTVRATQRGPMMPSPMAWTLQYQRR